MASACHPVGGGDRGGEPPGPPGARYGHRGAGLVPPLVAALGAYFLCTPELPGSLRLYRQHLGILIGADLLNLGQIRQLGAPVASIGGAGTFDAIFFSGILAVLLS